MRTERKGRGYTGLLTSLQPLRRAVDGDMQDDERAGADAPAGSSREEATKVRRGAAGRLIA